MTAWSSWSCWSCRSSVVYRVVIGTCIATGLAAAARAERPLEQIPFNGARAYEYLKQICAIGPRPSGSQGMQAQQALLIKHFRALGARVRLQPFGTRHPLDRSDVAMANLIVEWHPESRERILLCAHYDTRPRPDNDPNPLARRNGRFVGANDGASGVAVLMELGNMMGDLQSRYGVDFVLFDGEELVYTVEGPVRREIGDYFKGSTWFAQKYVQRPQEPRYRWGVLLDMVGDADLQLYQERYSMSWKDTRPLVRDLWATAARLGVKEFVARPKYLVRDDHLPLRKIGKIPTCDIIDFSYPVHPANRFWHSTEDTPDKCSPLSLAKVGWVVHEWLKNVE